MLDIILRDKIF